MEKFTRAGIVAVPLVLLWVSAGCFPMDARAQAAVSRQAAEQNAGAGAVSAQYQQVQARLARGWNTWDVHSVTTQVLLPQGLAIHVGMKHNSTLNGDAFLGDALIGRLDKGAEVVTPGAHAWDGSYTDLTVEWKGHTWRVESAHDGRGPGAAGDAAGGQVGDAAADGGVQVDFLWNRPGNGAAQADCIETRDASGAVPVYCTCAAAGGQAVRHEWITGGGAYFAADLRSVGVSTGKRRSMEEIRAAIERQHAAYRKSTTAVRN